MGKKQPRMSDFDVSWKEGVEVFFASFLQLFFPEIYEEIDWSKKPEFLDKELARAVPEAAIGKRTVDKLVKVYRKNGEKAWVYIHIEFQSQRRNTFPQRVFVYHSRLFTHYKRPILSLVVLGDPHPSWRPEHYEHELWGSHLLLKFRTVKLLDYRDRIEELEESKNPFAYFVIAHLKTLETRNNPHKRLVSKKALGVQMMQLGLEEETTYHLLKFMDMLMGLPEEEEQEYLDEIFEYQEKMNMPILAPFERIAREKGRVEGVQEGIQKGVQKGRLQGKKEGIQIGSVQEAQGILLEMLSERFGKTPATLRKTIQSLEDTSLLRRLCIQVLKVDSLKDFTRLIKENEN